MHVDFASIPFAELLARRLRRAVVSGSDVVLTEMVPNLDQAWPHTAEQCRCTAEIRMVALARGAGRD